MVVVTLNLLRTQSVAEDDFEQPTLAYLPSAGIVQASAGTPTRLPVPGSKYSFAIDDQSLLLKGSTSGKVRKFAECILF